MTQWLRRNKEAVIVLTVISMTLIGLGIVMVLLTKKAAESKKRREAFVLEYCELKGLPTRACLKKIKEF